MVRFLLILVVSILLITILRSVIGLIMRGFADLFGTQPPANADGTRRPPPVPAGGELKRDPVCGTYIAESASIKKTVRGEVLHFCSAECRDRYQG